MISDDTLAEIASSLDNVETVEIDRLTLSELVEEVKRRRSAEKRPEHLVWKVPQYRDKNGELQDCRIRVGTATFGTQVYEE